MESTVNKIVASKAEQWTHSSRGREPLEALPVGLEAAVAADLADVSSGHTDSSNICAPNWPNRASWVSCESASFCSFNRRLCGSATWPCLYRVSSVHCSTQDHPTLQLRAVRRRRRRHTIDRYARAAVWRRAKLETRSQQDAHAYDRVLRQRRGEQGRAQDFYNGYSKL
jgi:hypothetical protein